MVSATRFGGTAGLTEEERNIALGRFHIIQPCLDDGVPLARVAEQNHLSERTVHRWAKDYRQFGLAGLCRKARAGKRKRRMSPTLQQFIEGLALQKPRPTAAAVHRQAALVASRLERTGPSYRTVRRVIQGLDPALMMLAHEGTKSYSDRFDLVHRREAEAPNAIWQADHSELDMLVKDGEGKPRKPWLTIILDDYSRAVAGYLLFFGAPSTIQTALALRQAIWRKSQPGWHVCGIPQVLYTDHGSDFTSRHLEQVAADLKIRLIFSTAGKPRGRGKIERFFEIAVPGVPLAAARLLARASTGRSAVLTLPELDQELERYLIDEYLVTPHTHDPAGAAGPLGRRRVSPADAGLAREDSICSCSPCPSLAASIRTVSGSWGCATSIRRWPRMWERMSCCATTRATWRRSASSITIAFSAARSARNWPGETVALARSSTPAMAAGEQLRQTLQERRRLVDSLLEAKRSAPATQEPAAATVRASHPAADQAQAVFL